MSSNQIQYLIRLSQSHESFRLPELEALARQADVKLHIESYSPDSPFCVVTLSPNQNTVALLQSLDGTSGDGSDKREVDQHRYEIARHFISRSILAKSILELYATASDYPTLHSKIQSSSSLSDQWIKYKTSSFKFSIDGFNGKRSTTEQREIVESFSYLPFEGKISMKNPNVEFVVLEEWDELTPEEMSQINDGTSKVGDERRRPQGEKERKPKMIYFGRFLGASRRRLAEKHDLKKRPYISTTSMDAELALITANLALAGSGKIFVDPFVGTGGFLVAAAELGAIVLGSDIDGRSFRGKGRGVEKGIGLNFARYGLGRFYGDCVISDLTNSPFRHATKQRWIDGIVCDPPYGVREGLKVLGKRDSDPHKPDPSEEPKTSRRAATAGPYFVDGVPAHTLPGYIAPKKPYSFTRMLNDVLEFAASRLVDRGRLAFWMPSSNEVEEEFATPLHPLLELKHVCVQVFNKWSRKLLVYERIPATAALSGAIPVQGHSYFPESNGTSADELNPFRRKYFKGFVDNG